MRSQDFLSNCNFVFIVWLHCNGQSMDLMHWNQDSGGYLGHSQLFTCIVFLHSVLKFLHTAVIPVPGWRPFGESKIIPQSFRRARIYKFSRQKRRFLQLRKYWYFLL